MAALEAEAMGERSWHLVGEAGGAARPLNSALELDMDFETTGAAGGVMCDALCVMWCVV